MRRWGPRFSDPFYRAVYGLTYTELGSTLATIEAFREAIEFDLITLGLRLRDVGTDGLTWGDVYTIIRQSSRSSALFRAMNPDEFEWTLTNLLTAEVADAVRVANWQRGEGKRSDLPKPIPRPGVQTEKRYGREAVPMDVMAEWLGWK